MAKNSTKSTTDQEDIVESENTDNTPERSAPITVGPDRGGNLLAAWQGVFHLFGGHVDSWTVTPEGVIATNFSTNGNIDPSTVVEDVSGRDRRVDLVDAYHIVADGAEPPAFTNALEITKWMQQYLRKPGEDGKSPQYVKDAAAAYKKANAFPGRKGRPKKVVRIDSLGKLDPSLLADIDMSELENLQAVVASAMAARGQATTEVTA